MCRKSTLFASIILVSKKCGSTNYENCNRIRQPDTAINNTHRCDYDVDCITRSAILVLLQNQKFDGGKIWPDRLQDKTLRIQNFPDSELRLSIPDSKSQETCPKPGSFYFGFVHLCVNGKFNPVLKRSGFVTNPEKFPLV